MIRVLAVAHSSRRRLAELITLATLTLAFAPAAYASGSSMPLALEGAAADTAGRNVQGDADLDQIKDESYREMLKEYYRNLGEAGKGKP